MSKLQIEFQERYLRIFQAIFKDLASQAESSQLGQVTAGVHDAKCLLEKTINGKNIAYSAPIFFQFGKALGALALNPSYDRQYPQRMLLVDLSINYLMLARGIFEEQSQIKEATEALEAAHQYAYRLSPEGDVFPSKRLILSSFSAERKPKHICDVETARQMIIARQAEYKDCLSKIQIQLMLADHIYRGAEDMIRSAEMMFEIRLGDKIIRLRPDLKTPSGIKSGRSHIAGGRAYSKKIDTTVGDMANVNRARRAVVVARLMEALVKCALVDVYVAYWRKSPKYSSFSVLGHQARSYAQACTGHNWEFYAPPAYFFPHEPLIEKTERDVQLLCSYANSAYAYAICLDGELKVLGWNRDLIVLPEPVEELVPIEEPSVPMPVPPTGSAEKSTRDYYEERCKSQSDAASAYHSHTGEELRENAHYGIGQYDIIRAKSRLVGFDSSRGGKKHKNRKKVVLAGDVSGSMRSDKKS